MPHFVYLMASGRGGTLKVGETQNLVQRVSLYKRHAQNDSLEERREFTSLVWFEQHATTETAIRREREISGWSRARRVHLVEERNVNWRDLYGDLVGRGER